MTVDRIEESVPLRAAVATLCAYEVVAIVTGCVPTITALHRRHPEIGAAIVAALVWHFRLSKETR